MNFKESKTVSIKMCTEASSAPISKEKENECLRLRLFVENIIFEKYFSEKIFFDV